MKRIIQTKTGSRLRVPVIATNIHRTEIERILEKWGVPVTIIGGLNDSPKRKTIFCVSSRINGVPWIESGEDFETWLEANTERLPPPLVTQAVNFVTAVTEHIVAGLPETEPEVLQERRNICESCDRWQNSRCTECGCYTMVKTSWETQSCPLEKW